MIQARRTFSDETSGLTLARILEGSIDVWDKPGLGITFRVQQAKAHLAEEDRDFFD
jgi:hypothetical protein